jgi:hypothetical protein
MLVRVAALAAACLAVAGCGGDDPRAAAPVPTATATAAVLVPGDVEPDCRSHVPGHGAPAPPSLLQPPGAIAVRRVRSGAIARITGYVDLTPGAFLAAWRARPDVTLVDGEDEGFEAEVHLQTAAAQVFWQLKKVCDTGSTFTAVVTTAG